MDDILNQLPDWLLPAVIAVATLLGVQYRFPALYAWLLGGLKRKPAAKDDDGRGEAFDALVQVMNHVGSIECPQLRSAGDSACKTLAEVVIRPKGYKPEPRKDQTSSETA